MASNLGMHCLFAYVPNEVMSSFAHFFIITNIGFQNLILLY